MEKITKITDEESAQFEEYKKRWIEIGFDTKQYPDDEVREAINMAYNKAGLELPKDIEVFDDPHQAFVRFKELTDSSNPHWCFGLHDAAWLAFYDAVRGIYGERIPELKESISRLDGLIECAHKVGWWIPLDVKALVSRKPIEIHFDHENNRLHNEDGPAIQYVNNTKIYSLNGVCVPDWLVETRSEEIDPSKIHSIENAEVRREFVRKVGAERIFGQLAKIIDKSEDEVYELGSLDVYSGSTGGFNPPPRIYLKMRNPSIGVYHIEPVHPDCRTVQEALNWRCSGDRTKPWNPSQLT